MSYGNFYVYLQPKLHIRDNHKRFQMILTAKKCMLFLFAIPMLLTGCGDDGTPVKGAGATVAQSAREYRDTTTIEMQYNVESGIVLDRVKSIFKDVKATYLSSGGASMNELLDYTYCSKRWNSLVLAVRKKESQTNTLFFEVEYWSMAREPGFVTYDGFEVDKVVLGEKKFASVKYTVYETFTYTPARVDLVYEDGRWVIDNFYDLKYGTDVRNSMWYYLAHDII